MIVEDFKKVTPDLTTHTDLSRPHPVYQTNYPSWLSQYINSGL